MPIYVKKRKKHVKDAVQHLTQANFQIKDLHDQFSGKVSASSPIKFTIKTLMSRICVINLQAPAMQFPLFQNCF